VDYIEEHRDAFGVEPICTVLSSADVTIAPSTYYAARTRPPSARAVRDEEVTAEISKVHEENYGVYGVRKVHAQLGRDGGVHGRPVARCTVQRLMKAAGLRGISGTKGPPRPPQVATHVGPVLLSVSPAANWDDPQIPSGVCRNADGSRQ
jgi:putative transposase